MMRAWHYMLLASACGPAAHAQEVGPVGLPDIVVTATKRAENVQSVPASISVLTADSLVSRGISSPDQLALATPGMVFETINGFAQPYLRGVGSDQVTPAAELPIGIYLDGVYLSSPSASLQDFSDIERVEVLKGPQGTLYGRNSTGGAINVITRVPSEGFEGNASVTVGNFDIRKGTIYFGGGTEKLKASFAGVYSAHKGWMKNLFNGGRLNDQDQGGWRAKLVFTPDDTWTVTLSGDYFRLDDFSGSGFVPLDARPLALLLGGRVGTKYNETYDNTVLGHQETHWGLGLNIRGSFSGFDLVSISGYRRLNRFSYTDLDASDLAIADVSGPQFLNSFSQELQLVSNNNGPFEWIVGAYYFTSKGGFRDLLVNTPGASPAQTHIIGITSTDAYAVFGQGKYKFTENWALTLGGRYNHEKKRLNQLDVVIPEFGLTIPSPKDSRSWNNFSPKISLEYSQENLLLYATASKGFKSGSYNVTSPGESPVDPEKITAFEIGGKHTLFDRRVRFNWAGFLYNYKNLQVVTIAAGNGLTRLENAASSRNYGIDVDLTAAISDRLNASIGAEWLHARFRRFPNASVFIPNAATGGYGFVATLQDVSGNHTTRSPEFSLSGQVQYTVPFESSDLRFTGAYQYSGSYFFDSANQLRQKSYNKLNLNAALEMHNGITLSAFVNNVFNEHTLSGVAQTALVMLSQYSAPRTYGVSAGIKF